MNPEDQCSVEGMAWTARAAVAKAQVRLMRLDGLAAALTATTTDGAGGFKLNGVRRRRVPGAGVASWWRPRRKTSTVRSWHSSRQSNRKGACDSTKIPTEHGPYEADSHSDARSGAAWAFRVAQLSVGYGRLLQVPGCF